MSDPVEPRAVLTSLLLGGLVGVALAAIIWAGLSSDGKFVRAVQQFARR